MLRIGNQYSYPFSVRCVCITFIFVAILNMYTV